MSKKVPPQFVVLPPPPPAAPATTTVPSNPVTSFGDWVRADMAYKESQSLNVSDGGKGVSN